MTIYEIARAIEALLESAVDPETGELVELDAEALDSLELARETKIEDLALAVKNLTAVGAAIRAEENALRRRRETVDRRAQRAREYLDYVLAGERFETARVTVSYRKAARLELADGFEEWAAVHAPDFLRYKEPEPDKRAITEAIKAGRQLDGAELVERQTMTIR